MTETTWNYSVQDFSPLLTYEGSSGQGLNLDPAWNQSCPFQTLPNGQNYMKAICDVSSTHTTNKAGASVSLTFYGQAVLLFGNVTEGMLYDVDLDGSVSAGIPSGQILASISSLKPGNHTVKLTAKPSSPTSGGVFLFESAIVTVGTGLTGASVNRTVFQDDDIMFNYSPPPNSSTTEHFDSWHIPAAHEPYNSSWVEADTVSFSFSGNAILLYGGSFSWFNSINNFSLDGHAVVTLFPNSALPRYIMAGGPNFLGNMYTSGLLYVQTNLANTPLNMMVDSNRDSNVPHVNLDYIEVISITGGSPLRHPVPVAIIVGPAVGAAVLLLFVVFSILMWRKWATRTRHPFDMQEELDSEMFHVDPNPILLQSGLPPQTGMNCRDADPADRKVPVLGMEQTATTPLSSIGPNSSGTFDRPLSGTATWTHTPSPSRLMSTQYRPSVDSAGGSTFGVDSAQRLDAETEFPAAKNISESPAQDIQEMRRELDQLWQVLRGDGLDQPPPDYERSTRSARS